MTKPRKPMPSLDRVRASYHRQMELLVGIKLELDEAMKDFMLGHDAGLAALKSGTGKLGSRSSGRSDPTTQAGYDYHRLQGACAFAAGKLLGAERDLIHAERSLERASTAILEAWLDTDPDLGPERRAMRAAALQQQLLTENDTGVTIPPAGVQDGAGTDNLHLRTADPQGSSTERIHQGRSAVSSDGLAQG